MKIWMKNPYDSIYSSCGVKGAEPFSLPPIADHISIFHPAAHTEGCSEMLILPPYNFHTWQYYSYEIRICSCLSPPDAECETSPWRAPSITLWLIYTWGSYLNFRRWTEPFTNRNQIYWFKFYNILKNAASIGSLCSLSCPLKSTCIK